MSNAYTEIRAGPFIWSLREDFTNSENHDWVQVLSYIEYSLLFTNRQDWTYKLQMISLRIPFQANAYIHCTICPAGQVRQNFWDE